MNTTEMRFDIVVVFFIYGLAFFSMGLTMMMEARRSPLLAEARVLWPLAFFGFVHGSHEWMEIGLDVRRWFGFDDPQYVPWIRLLLLVVSFASLVLYSLQVLRPKGRMMSQTNAQAVLALLGLYLILIFSVGMIQPSSVEVWQARADALARYTLAVPGAGLASLALIRQASQTETSERRGLKLSLHLAALGFAVYSLTQVLVTPTDIFPARYLNSAAFLNWAGFPIQAVRACMAALVTVSLIRATQVVERDRQRQFASAQEARFLALEQIRLELAEREALRRELLRHTVAAQEEERARIARELHDETAQFLTALSLDLATLKKSLRNKPDEVRILERAHALSGKMSQGIYRMVHDLRPAQLDDLGIVAALGYLAYEARRSGLQVILNVEGNRQRLDPLIETVLFRIAQEALTNVTCHSGADKATVLLAFEACQIKLAIQDQGSGFDPDEIPLPPHGWGLVGMRERAESLAGSFRIHSAPGIGTLIEVVVPLTENEQVLNQENSNEYNPLNAR